MPLTAKQMRRARKRVNKTAAQELGRVRHRAIYEAYVATLSELFDAATANHETHVERAVAVADCYLCYPELREFLG